MSETLLMCDGLWRVQADSTVQLATELIKVATGGVPPLPDS